MSFRLNKYQLEKYSRQIILKDVGALGQKKIIKSKVLIVGMGGLGCPVAEFLTRAGIGNIGIVDFDKVDLSNIHRQSLFNLKDLKKSKVIAAKKKLNKINTQTKVMFSMKTAIGWSEPTPVHIGHDLFVNWADFPSIAILSDTTIAVHWLQKIGKSGFDYQINIALSSNNGKTWSNPKILHEDRSPVQHGFVSMTPSKEKLLTIIWLDGRTYGVKLGETKNETEAMQLRATTITSEGSIAK